MQNAELYARANGLQRRDTKYIIDNYVRRLFRWRSDGHESLLDIGCGSGDVTIDLVLPLLSAVTYRRLVGVDLEPSMLRFARNALAQQPDVRVAFELLDIGRPLRANELLQGGLCDWRTESFDHITSFFCLHWVHDQRQTIRNVHDLLAPSGECVLAFIAQHALYDVFFELSERPRWAPFMRDAAKWINPYQKSTSPVDEMLAHLQAAGFSESAVHLLDREYVYENEAAARGAMSAVTPAHVFHHMDNQQQEDFMDDVINCLRSEWEVPTKHDGGIASGVIRSTYKVMVVFARK